MASGRIPFAAGVVLPYTRLELPGWGKLYSRFVHSGSEARWRDAGVRSMRGKLHGYQMKLDLSYWSDRHTYFIGRYYDLPTQLFLLETLQPGDRFVDIGANIGMLSLVAARAVGPAGVVDAYEPNPACCERLQATVRENGIANVRVHAHALGPANASLSLSVIPTDSGMSTLCAVPAEDRAFERRLAVPVRRADQSLAEDPRPIAQIKIDVEGFEYQVLEGLIETLDRWRPTVILEMEPANLARDRRKPVDLVEFMSARGYQGFGLTSSRRFLRHRLSLLPLHRSDSHFPSNVVFRHPNRPR